MSDEYNNIVDLATFRMQKEREAKAAEAAATQEEIEYGQKLLDIFLSQFPPTTEPYYVPLTTSYLYDDTTAHTPPESGYEYGYEDWVTVIDNEGDDEDF